jgi:hypothetical protein
MLLIVNGAVPVFFNVAICAALAVPTNCDPKASEDGVRLTAGAGLVPSPLSASSCGLPAASSVTVTLAGRVPVAVGANVTEIVHVAPTASVLGASGHEFVCA